MKKAAPSSSLSAPCPSSSEIKANPDCVLVSSAFRITLIPAGQATSRGEGKENPLTWLVPVTELHF